jgi:hypothetical protein
VRLPTVAEKGRDPGVRRHPLIPETLIVTLTPSSSSVAVTVALVGVTWASI